ncbi:MAG: flavin reductase family protein [Anaerolineae bacterium]
MKREVPLSSANRLLNNGPVVLVTAMHRGQPNVMTVAWVTPLSFDPPLVGVAISPRAFTHQMIKQSEFFVLNVPGRSLAEQVEKCGRVSGQEVDKFAVVGLTPTDAVEVEAPWIEECLAHLECGVVNAITLGDHTLFVGRVITAWAEEEAFEETWLLEEEELKPLHHLGASFYGVLEERIDLAAPEEEEEE